MEAGTFVCAGPIPDKVTFCAGIKIPLNPPLIKGGFEVPPLAKGAFEAPS